MPTITLYPAVSGDDYMWYTGGSLLQAAASVMAVGPYGSTGDRSGIRFPSASIPKGSVISSAVLTLYSYGSTSGETCNAKIYGNDADNAVAPTSHAQAQGLDLTTAFVSWNGIGSWTAGSGYDTPGLATIIQEIIDRDGWSSGNAIQIIIHDDGSSVGAYRTPHAWDGGNPAYYPKLVITYVENTVLEIPPFAVQGSLALKDVFCGYYVVTAPISSQGSLDLGSMNILLAPGALSSDSMLDAGIKIQLPCPAFSGTSLLVMPALFNGILLSSPALAGVSSLTAALSLRIVPPALAGVSSLTAVSLLDMGLSLPPFSANSLLTIEKVTTFIDQDFKVTYLCVLSASGLADVVLPMSFFQGRLRSGDPSFLSMIIPGLDYADDIADRADGTLRVYMVKTYRDGNRIMENLAAADLDDIRVDQGAMNQSITLSGYRTETYSPKTVRLTGASYKMIYDGKKRYRCQPDLYLRPGDTVVIGEDSFTADVITWAIGNVTEIMEVAEAE